MLIENITTILIRIKKNLTENEAFDAGESGLCYRKTLQGLFGLGMPYKKYEYLFVM